MTKQSDVASGAFGFIGMLLPVLYFGGFLYYFSGVGGGTLQGAVDMGLGPTMLGLATLGLLFSIKPLWLILRFTISLVAGRPAPGPRGGSTGPRDDGGSGGESSGFDADDAIARYLARREAGEGDAVPAASLVAADPVEPLPPRAAFGRKSV